MSRACPGQLIPEELQTYELDAQRDAAKRSFQPDPLPAAGHPLGKWIHQGLRVTAAAAGIRLSTRKVYKVDTLKWKLTGLVNPDVEFDIANRSGR